MTEGNLEMSSQWSAPSTYEADEIPLPTLEEVKFAVVK
jgi:hypothetical protein